MKFFKKESGILLFMGIRRIVFPHLHSLGDCMCIVALSQIWSILSKTSVIHHCVLDDSHKAGCIQLHTYHIASILTFDLLKNYCYTLELLVQLNVYAYNKISVMVIPTRQKQVSQSCMVLSCQKQDKTRNVNRAMDVAQLKNTCLTYTKPEGSTPSTS